MKKPTFWINGVAEVRLSSVRYLLHDDREAVYVAFLCSVDWTLLHAQQFGRCPQEVAIVGVLANLKKLNKWVAQSNIIDVELYLQPFLTVNCRLGTVQYRYLAVFEILSYLLSINSNSEVIIHHFEASAVAT